MLLTITYKIIDCTTDQTIEWDEIIEDIPDQITMADERAFQRYYDYVGKDNNAEHEVILYKR